MVHNRKGTRTVPKDPQREEGFKSQKRGLFRPKKRTFQLGKTGAKVDTREEQGKKRGFGRKTKRGEEKSPPLALEKKGCHEGAERALGEKSPQIPDQFTDGEIWWVVE